MKVSVIIPNFNRAKLVGDTIANMLRQTLSPHEIIVVDDGSTDDSAAVVRSFGAKVILLEQPNQGPGASRNAGLKVASGDYIQFMDSDDLASLNKLEIQAQALERANADIAYGPWAKVWIENRRVRFEGHVLQVRPLPPKYSFLEWFLMGWSTVLQACLFRRSLIQKTAPMRSDLMVWEDGEFLVRLLAWSPSILFTPECLTLYRLHSEAKLTETGTTLQRRLADRLLAMESISALLLKQPSLCCDRAGRVFREAVDRATDEVRGRAAAPPLSRRIREYLRRRMRGDHWPHYYCSERPGATAAQRLADLGFEGV